jgi:CHAD domain-containing protein
LQQGYQPEQLYTLRVGMRRIRSMLKPMDSTRSRRFRKTWGGFATVTNRARDWDVFLVAAEDLLPMESFARFKRRHREDLQSSHEAVLELLSSAHWHRHVQDWQQFLVDLDNRAIELSAPAAIDVALSRARAALAAAQASGDDRAWHKLRIAVKEIRYQSESCAGSGDAGQRQAALAESCKPLQALLGGWHDCVVQLQMLQEMGPAPEHDVLGAVIATRRAERIAEIETTVEGHPLFAPADS